MAKISRNPEKARRAARNPERPGEHCHAEPASFAPQVNRERCEGKAECVEVCPYDVFEIGTLTDAEYNAMPWLTRLKQRVHGKKTARTPRAADCLACGLCVVACPEKAITLVRTNE